MSEPTTPERICPQCGIRTPAMTCPEHGIQTLARTANVDTVQTGEIIGGRFRVEKLLGKGGFGAVFRATHIVTQQELVLKVLKPNLSEDETQIKRFLQEARTASRLSHPNTVRVYDFGQTDAGHLYIAMELLHGQELGQVLIDEGLLAPARAIHIAIGVLKSLAEAHQAGLVHRDLKPDNIFLCRVPGEDDFVKVIDFGIAKPIEQGDDGGLTRTGFTVGTPKYMSPEQVLNKGVEGRSDLYSLGVILYQSLSGELPLSGPSPVETMMAHVQQEPAALSLVCPQELPPGLEAIVMRALRKQPNERFVDAEDMRAALEEVQEAAGLTTGRKARSAKMRAVTPLDMDTTSMHPMPPQGVRKTAPAPELVPPQRVETAKTVQAKPLQAESISLPDQVISVAPANTTVKTTAPQPTLRELTPPVHLDATLDLPRQVKQAEPPRAKRSYALPVVGAIAAIGVLVAVWLALGKDAPAPTPPAEAAKSAADEAAPPVVAAPPSSPSPRVEEAAPPAPATGKAPKVAAPAPAHLPAPEAAPAVEPKKAAPKSRRATVPAASKPNGDEAL
jgi:serine/threonine protein kinase